jgi:preprotein translocase subunit SecD
MQLLKTMAVCSIALALWTGCTVIGALRGSSQAKVDTTVRIYEQSDSALPAETVQTAVIPSTGLRLTINPFPTLTERDVQSAEVYNTAGGKAVFLRFDPHGVIALDEMTTRTRGGYLVVMVNNHPVSAWLVDQRILNGQFLVEGDFTDEEAQKIVDDLNKLSKQNNR